VIWWLDAGIIQGADMRKRVLLSIGVFVLIQVLIAVGYYLSGAESARGFNLCMTYFLGVSFGVLGAGCTWMGLDY